VINKRLLYTWLSSCAFTGFGVNAGGQVITDLPGLDGEPATATYIKASNAGAYERFGEATAISADGSTLAVSAIFEDSSATGIDGDQDDFAAPNAGSVYVFVRSGDGWAQEAYIKASNTEAADRFGRTVSLSSDGNTLAVGAMSEDSASTGVNGDQDDNSIGNAGAVYVFARQGSEWSQQAYIKASNTGGELDGDQFGHDVGLSGDGNTLAVGAVSEDSAAKGVDGDQSDNSLADAGAVYVYTRNGATWSQQAYIKSEARDAGQTFQGLLFGYSVGLDESGDTLAVGAYNEGSNRGSIYVFARNNDRWTQQSRLTASNAEIGDALGTDVAVSADGLTIAGGAFDEDSSLIGTPPGDQGSDDQPTDNAVGAVYVFVNRDGEWSQQAFIKPTHAQANQHFGWSLALSADAGTLLVGAHFEDGGARGINGEQQDASAEDAGAAYLYKRNGTQWTPVAYLKASNTHEYAEFATAVSLSANGDLIVIGAPRESSSATGIGGEQNDLSAPESGAVYIY
jgi:hypothetical protein